jgi:hypothetical protein
VHAATTGEQAHVASTATETSWPDFVPRALAAGVSTVVSSPLTVNAGPVGALNIYSHGNEAFGAAQHELAQLIPGQAAGILADDSDELSTAERVGRLQDALRTREVIARAQGILMERDRATAEGAATSLRRSSRQADIPLRALAANIIATAAAPTDPRTDA